MESQVVLNEKQSTYGSPYGFYTVTLTPFNRTKDSVSITCDVSAHLQFATSWTGYKVTCGLRIGGGEWTDFVIYAGGGTETNGKAWKGTTPKTASVTVAVSGLSVTQTKITDIQFRAIRQSAGGPQLNATACSDLNIDMFGGIVNLNIDGVHKDTLPWKNIDGTWHQTIPWKNVDGVWKIGV